MQMPFGKHKGQELDDVPVSYLRWVLHNVPLTSDYLREAIEEICGEEATATESTSHSGWNVRAGGSVGSAPRRAPSASSPGPVCKACGVGGFLDRDGHCGVCGSDPVGERIIEMGRAVRESVNKWRRAMAHKYHPDRNPDSVAIMIAINTAGDDILGSIEKILSKRS